MKDVAPNSRGIATGTTVCGIAVPSHNPHTYRIDHTYSFGSLATSRYWNVTGGVGYNHYITVTPRRGPS